MTKRQGQKARICAELGRISTAQEQQADAMGTMAKAFTTLAKATTSLVKRMDERSQAEAILAAKRAKKADAQAKWRDGQKVKSTDDVVSTVDNKEEKDGTREETTPLHPSKEEKKGEKEERRARHHACAREDSPSFATQDGNPNAVREPNVGTENYNPDPTHPTVEQIVNWARKGGGGVKESVAREAYEVMVAWGWRWRDNQPIENWRYFVKQYATNKPMMDKVHDPERIPDARKQSRRISRADNWRAADPRERDDVF